MVRTVAFVVSHNRSGSTWLSLMLGSHSAAFYVGEANKLYSKKDTRGCATCTAARRPCPYLSGLERVPRPDFHQAVFDRTGASLLVDNSKRVKWCSLFTGEDRHRRKYIHLVRDPRGVHCSLLAREAAPDVALWARRHQEIHSFLSAGGLDQMMLTYEELAADTPGTLERLNRWLGLAYEPGQEDYWRFEHHGPGTTGATTAFIEQSNTSDRGYYTEKSRTHFTDTRWKTRLDDSVIRAIESNEHVAALLDQLGLALSEDGLVPAGAPEGRPGAGRPVIGLS